MNFKIAMISYPHFAMPNLHLENGYLVEESSYGEIVSYVDEDALEACVRKILVRIPRGLNGRQLRFLRRGLEISQEVFGTLIDRDTQTVARLEKSDAAVPKLVDLAIRTRFFGRYEPSVSIGEILSIHDGATRFPTDKIVLSHVGGKWSYRFDVPKLIVEITKSQSSGGECLISEATDGGHIYQRRLVISANANVAITQDMEGHEDDRTQFSSSASDLCIAKVATHKSESVLRNITY
ncbi:MAG: hypothetical protein IPH35_03850 [Rhodoferax sp.]|nr:hypothetical protein [Rhodoferax sp.]